jgi:peptidoglycan/xylan/chitin deacetylase (PgdA/CDA1 family)
MEPRDYGPFPYVPINDRPILKWPNGARLAVWIIPNIEFFPLTQGIPGSVYSSHAPVPSVRAWAQRDYGNRVGIWRIMEVLQKHKVRASPTLNSDVCDHHPQIVKAAVELGWEILGHNETNSRWLNQMEPGEEGPAIARTLSKIGALSGRKPVGWLGAGLAETWDTLDHLIDEGCLYVADWVSDDQPFWMDIGAASGRLDPLFLRDQRLALPAHPQRHDRAVRGGDKAPVRHALRRGRPLRRVMAICLHPYLIGVPHRIAGLDEARTYIAAHDGVWFATGEEIVRAWLESGATF